MENLIKNLMVLDDDLNGFHIHAVIKCPSNNSNKNILLNMVV